MSRRPGEEKVLQAVVLADSFDERFMPLTLDRPRCLIPLANAPLLEHTLEALAVAGVQEAFVYVRAHADMVRQWLARSRWAASTLTVHVVVGGDACSAGDALRDIDARGLVAADADADFVLVHCADVVASADIGAALAHHRRLRATVDRGFALTMVLAQASPQHRVRGPCWPGGALSYGGADGDGVFALDARTGECVAYAPISLSGDDSGTDSEDEYARGTTTFGSLDPVGSCVRGRSASKCASAGAHTRTSVAVPARRVLGSALRYDLVDVGVDICAASVLALFTENFDYADVRRDFVRGVLASDVLGVRVAAHVLPRRGGHYTARARTPHHYDAVSRDVLGRWAFPVVPEALGPAGVVPRRGNRYVAADAVVSRAATLGTNVLLGPGVHVGERAVVADAVLGAGVHVGADAVVEGAYLWEGVRVGDGCVVRGAIIADGAVLRAGTRVEPGTLIASNVVLGGPGVVVGPGARVAKLGEHVDARASSGSSFGAGSDAVLWTAGADALRYAVSLRAPRVRHPPPMATDTDSDSEAPDVSALSVCSEDSVRAEDDDSVSLGTSSYGRNTERFERDARDLVRHAVRERYALDNALLELNSLKFACNATLAETREVVCGGLLAEAFVLCGHELDGPSGAGGTLSETDAHGVDGRTLQAAVERVFLPYAGLLERFSRGGPHEQERLLDAVARTCARHAATARAFVHVVPVLYKADVLDGDAVLAWYARQDASSLPARQMRPFAEWLQQSDGETDTETESSSDE